MIKNIGSGSQLPEFEGGETGGSKTSLTIFSSLALQVHLISQVMTRHSLVNNGDTF